MAAAIPLGKILIEKDLEKERKRDAAQMSAVAVGFFLDREGHKKFLRTATNQELEAENIKLKYENEHLKNAVDEKTDECGYYYSESMKHERAGIHLFAELEQARDSWDELDKENERLKIKIRSQESMLVQSWRPRHKDIDWKTMSEENTHRDAFLMDFENSCLADFARESYPQGLERCKDEMWRTHIQSQVYPAHSDVDWTEYVAWVEAGKGDEYFIEEKAEESSEEDTD